MKFLDETGMGVFWALVKEYIANHVEEVTNNYLPLTGGTVTGRFTVDNDGTSDFNSPDLLINDPSSNGIRLYGNIIYTGDDEFNVLIDPDSSNGVINIHAEGAPEDAIYFNNQSYIQSLINGGVVVGNVSISGTGNAITNASYTGGTLTLTKGNISTSGNYLPLTGGTLTGGLNINSNGGLTTIGKLTTSSGFKTNCWKSWAMRNSGSVDEIAAIWYVENKGIRLVRVSPDDIDSADPSVLFTPFKFDTDDATWFCNNSMYISRQGIFHTKQLVSDNNDSISGYGSLELYSATPFIDFHYNKSQADYTSRIIESESGVLTVSNNLSVNGKLKIGPASPGIKTESWLCSTMINDSGDGATGCYKFYCNNDAVLFTSHSPEDIDNTLSQSKYTYFHFNDSTNAYQMNFANNTISFYQNGRIMATEFYENSDITLKENVDSISESDLNKVKDIEFKEFNFTNDEDKTKKYGVIAQEVEEAGLDNLVSTNAEGKKAVDYISLLVLKIQALEKRVAELEAERR